MAVAAEGGFEPQKKSHYLKRKLDAMMCYLDNGFFGEDAGTMFGEYGTFLPVRQSHPNPGTLPEPKTRILEKTFPQKRIRTNGSTGSSQSGQKVPSGQLAKQFDKYSSFAEIVLKEASDLKNVADRLKNRGNKVEMITEIYFDAALKFLSGANALESSNNKFSETKKIVDIYTNATTLFKYCAETCETNGKTALAYKCMEVTHFRVIMFLYSGDRHETQKNNLNPQVDVDQLLRVAEHSNAAMDASLRCHSALESTTKGNSCDEIKKVIDFSFHDLEGFIRLVRSALKNTA